MSLVVAAIAGSFFSFTSATANPENAEGCARAPRSAAPQGAHWYYRTDRATRRKCWFLATQEDGVRKVVPRPARAQAAEPVAPTAGKNALVRLIPLAKNETADARALLARSASMTAPEPAAPPAVPADFAERLAGMSGPAPEFASEPAADSTAPDVPSVPQPVVTAQDFPTAAQIRLLEFVLGGFALVCLVASIAFYIAGAKLRRVKVQILDLSLKAPLRGPLTEVATTTPAPPVRPTKAVERSNSIEEDIERRLREFSQAWKRKAA